jgi:flagellar protein FlgJ
MSIGALQQNALAADGRSLNKLKFQAGQNSPEAIHETAKQLESLFMRELIKSMREATMKSGMLDNAGTDLGSDLLDQQLASQMTGLPGGLGDLIAKQLTRQMGGGESDALSADDSALSSLSQFEGLSSRRLPGTKKAAAAKTQSDAAAVNALNGSPKYGSHQTQFVKQQSDIAEKVAKESGIPASYMIGQAGHETGWGQFQIKMKGGASSHNLFGIKADSGWKGKVAEVTTTEFVNGKPEKRLAKFRAYDNYEDAYRDYARLISESPRYAKAREQTGSSVAYANGLQRAGYATDPDYANKLSRAITTAQRIQRNMT